MHSIVNKHKSMVSSMKIIILALAFSLSSCGPIDNFETYRPEYELNIKKYKERLRETDELREKEELGE